MNTNDVIDFLREKYLLKYFVYNKSSEYILPTAVRLEIEFRDRKYYSWGVSEDRDLAFFKALMEILERTSVANACSLVFKKSYLSPSRSFNFLQRKYLFSAQNFYPDNSNGCGIALSKNKAKISAYQELVERHVLLSALILQVVPTEVSYDFPPSIKLPSKKKIRFFFWKQQNLYVVISVLIEENAGFYFGFSCSEDLKSSCKRAFEELTPSLIFSERDLNKASEDFRIKKNDIYSFSRYWRHSGDRSMLSFLEGKLGRSDKKIPELKNVYFNELLIPSEFSVLAKGIRCMRAISPEAQQLFFDNWNTLYINPQIFSNFSLPTFPHPIA